MVKIVLCSMYFSTIKHQKKNKSEDFPGKMFTLKLKKRKHYTPFIMKMEPRIGNVR